MIELEKLTAIYLEEYAKSAAKRPKNAVRYKDYSEKINRLAKNIERARASRMNEVTLEEYHKQIKNLYGHAVRRNLIKVITQMQQEIIPKLALLDYKFLMPEQREAMEEDFVEFLQNAQPLILCSQTLFRIYSQYREYRIKNRMVDLVPTHPEMEFPETMQMERTFILHIGPTNSGKTFQALQRLKMATDGIYLGPLRLLALEVYEKMQEYGVPCTMLTGQEEIVDEDSRVMASTIEMAEYDKVYDIAVIDEAQMMADPDRGHSWTKAILGLRAREIHICMSPAAEKVVTHLIGLCGDHYEEHFYERKTALVCEEKPFVFPDDVQPGDALIVFSKREVLDVAGRLEAEHIESSVIYGSLPPEIRRRQTHLFAKGKTKVAVSTDAIGMGLNLPVRRIVFLQIEKFDGTRTRKLAVPEVKQIGGRAGRFGIYNTGYITAMGEEELEYIRQQFYQEEQVMDKVILGFPQVLLSIEDDLDTILKVWKSENPPAPFEKEEIDEALFLYDLAKKHRNEIDGFEDKHLLYKMITCPINQKDRQVVNQWLKYCQTWSADISLSKPRFEKRSWEGLAQYETYYHKLDLYYQFSHRMGKEIDEKWLRREKEKTEASIMRQLARGKSDYIARCQYCARPLPFGYPYRICERCYWQD